jgi:hypothetical protein
MKIRIEPVKVPETPPRERARAATTAPRPIIVII